MGWCPRQFPIVILVLSMVGGSVYACGEYYRDLARSWRKRSFRVISHFPCRYGVHIHRARLKYCPADEGTIFCFYFAAVSHTVQQRHFATLGHRFECRRQEGS